MRNTFYPEPLLVDNNFNEKSNKFKNMVEEILSLNSAVGIIGGYTQESCIISFISTFTTNMLGYTKENQHLLIDKDFYSIIYGNDKDFLFSKDYSENDSHLIRLIAANKKIVFANIIKRNFINEEGKELWIASLRLNNFEYDNELNFSKYQFQGLIDKKERKYFSLEDIFFNSKEKSFFYDKLIENLCRKYVYPSCQSEILTFVNLDNIVSKIDEFDTCEILIPVETKNEFYTFRANFAYINKEKRLIHFTAEDITDLTEKDFLTDSFTYKGFIINYNKYLKKFNKDKFYSIMYFDVIGYKAITQNFGYDIGNKLLKKLFSYFKKSIPNILAICRTDADHFIGIIKTIDLSLDMLKNVCTTSLEIDGLAFNLNIRVGIYKMESSDNDIRFACDKAKLTLQTINKMSLYSIYNSEISDNYYKECALYDNIQEAIKNDEFDIQYQPIFDAKTRKICFAEALSRWTSKKYGKMSPNSFIPKLEANGQISIVDQFVINKVKEFLTKRNEEKLKNIPITINLSRVDLYNEKFLENINSFLSKTNDKKYFFEITESSCSSIINIENHLINKLQENGAKILIDDFGSGYSTFSTIIEYKFDFVKLDKNIIDQINKGNRSNSIIKSLIDLGHSINCKIIAEGVEEKDQYKFLLENNCDYIQGYYFSKPISKENLEKLIDQTE